MNGFTVFVILAVIILIWGIYLVINSIEKAVQMPAVPNRQYR